MIKMHATELPDDAAFEAYLATWRKELDANWDGGYAQIPTLVRNDASLSAKAKLVYEQLLSFMWFRSDRCWPSQATLAQGTGYSRRTVIRAVQELYERGYIECVRRGLGQTNNYFVNPLSFARSFRPIAGPRTAVRMPHSNRMVLTDPAFLYGISDAVKRPVEPCIPEVTNCHTGSDRMAHQEVTDCHSNYTKANLIHLNQDTDSDSSGVAASFDKEEVGGSKETCSHIAHVTIRNEKTDTTDTTDSTPNPTPRNSNPTSVPSETGGAARAKEAKASIMEEKLSRWQALALAHGISLVQQDALDSYIKHCSRPTHIPVRVEQALDPLSRKYNNTQYLASNRTQATKLWQYARLRGMDHEYLHDTFQEWVDAASATTVPSFVKNKMAWFFKALRLEVLKALLPYERVASLAEEQPTSAASDETTSQEYEELRQDEQETSISDEEAINQEQDAPPVPTNDEQECQEQLAPEPESFQTDDLAAGWMTQGTALHWAERLRECVGQENYGYDVLPTRFGRWVLYLYTQDKQGQPGGERTYYTETSSVKARLRGETANSTASF